MTEEKPTEEVISYIPVDYEIVKFLDDKKFDYQHFMSGVLKVLMESYGKYNEK